MRKLITILACTVAVCACAAMPGVTPVTRGEYHPKAAEWESRASAAAVLRGFGLDGRLARDCSAPVGLGSAIFLPQPDGSVEIQGWLVAGMTQGQPPRVSRVVRARMLDRDTLETLTEISVRGGNAVVTRWVREDGAYKLMVSIRANDGFVFFHDGVDGPNVYPWLRPCSA